MISCYSSTAGNGSAGWLAPGPIAPASPPAQSATPPIPASGSSEAECYKVEQVEGLRRRAHAALATPASTAPAGCMPPNGSAFEAFDSCASSNSSLLCFGLHTISEEESSDCHSTISFSAASGSSSGSTCSSPAAHGGPWSESDWCSAGGSSSSGSSSSCCREALEQVMARVHAATRTLAEIRPAPLDAACAAAAAAHGQLEPLQVGSPSHHKHGPAAQAATALDLWQLAWTGAPGWGDELPASHAGRPYPAAHDQNQRHQFSGHATPPPPLPATLLPAGKEVSAAKAPQPLLKSTGSGRSSSHGSGGAMLAAPRGPAPRGAGLTRRAPAATCWWVLLGTLLGAAAGGGSTMAAYGLLSYISKAALAFGLVWKGALGAAALEGGVVGGAGAGTLRALRVRETRMARELWSVSEESARERATFAELLRQQRARAEHQLECLQVGCGCERLYGGGGHCLAAVSACAR